MDSTLPYISREELDELENELRITKDGYAPDIDLLQRTILLDLITEFRQGAFDSGMADLKRDRRTVAQLLAAAARDTDAASVFYDGAGSADYDSAILVIKGRENVDYVVAMLARQQLVTPGKPVEGSAVGGVKEVPRG